MMMWRNQSVGGARCVAAAAALVETSHVANWKSISPAEMCMKQFVYQMRVQQRGVELSS